MRILLFLLIGVFSFTQNLTAQTDQNIWAEMEVYITDHLDDPAPNEKQKTKAYKIDLLSEGAEKVEDKYVTEMARRVYWGTVFKADNEERFLNEKKAKSGPQILKNPDLVETCELDIVIIVDRSGSVQGDEITNIRNGLLAMVQNQIGTGNTLTFVGMGDSDSEDPISSVTVTYGPGISGFMHNIWINNTLSFGGDCDNCDSWSSGLEEASGNNADLVLMITDGNDGHGLGEEALTIAAGNVLKSNGANDGNGAHLFVLGLTNGFYTTTNNTGNNTTVVDLPTAVEELIAPSPTQASPPLTISAISANDFIGLSNEFANISSLLDDLELCCEDWVYINWISSRTCLMGNVYISGAAEICQDFNFVGINLQFWNGSNNVVTVPVTVNADGTWVFTSTRQDMEALGIIPGLWYDVVPVMVFADGTTLSGNSYISGSNNDVYFPEYADPSFILNDSPSDWNTSLNSFCEGTTIYYHGTDPVAGAGGNHHPQIKRRPIGSTADFGDWQGYGGVGTGLDGHTGSLNDLFPGYFMVGYEYQITIGSYNNSNCVAWENVTVEFEIVPCCEPEIFIAYVPECVESGETFEVIVELIAPLSADDIEAIYSHNNSYSYVSHYTSEIGGTLLLFMTFEVNKCSCEGEVLFFDIRLVGCTGVICIMTDPIPCCAEECENVTIEDWYAEDCEIVNGLPARYFCLEVASDDPISAIYPTTPESVTCKTEIVGLEFANVGGTNLYTVCGYMVFTDPDCTFHAEVNLSLQTKSGCCAIVQNFSFSEGCTLDELCLYATPNIEVIQNSNISVTLDIPQGQTVSVFDVLTQTTTTYTVENVLCPPFGLINGQLVGNLCNGINITSATPIDCRTTDDTPISLPYHLELSWDKCSWSLIGNYCDEFIHYPGGIDKGNERSSKVENSDQMRSDEISVFPNPMDQNGVLNFDFSELKTEVRNIRVTDISGKMLEYITLGSEQKTFQHQWTQPLLPGIYFLAFDLADGQFRSTKLVVTE